jgi:hypothetical protein
MAKASSLILVAPRLKRGGAMHEVDRITAKGRRVCLAWSAMAIALSQLAGCGGGGSPKDVGPDKITLTVAASDADGDALQYEWRVTNGSVENRNARSTVWTLPQGPGLHFAYVTVTDGKGGYAQMQYAVGSDALELAAPVAAPVSYAPKVFSASTDTPTTRLRMAQPRSFQDPGSGAAVNRSIYLADVRVEVRNGTSLVASGVTDWNGELPLGRVAPNASYSVSCAQGPQAALQACGGFTAGATAQVVSSSGPSALASDNLRLHGHLQFRDGGVCGVQDEYFNLQATGTVQLLLADGAAVTPPLRVNRFGDYALWASVPVKAALQLRVRCGNLDQTLAVPASADPVGYVGSMPVELSATLANARPRIEKLVANGPEGNVRGKLIVAEAGSESNQLPGATQFLAYKSLDTRQGACAYYKALGAAKDCDAQGGMSEAISLDDWRKAKKLAPYASGNVQVRADYINKMDLNLVRRMEATKTGDNDISFVVCNHPGPDGQSQAEVNEVMRTALAGERLIACVAMEWSTSPGVNGGKPFTKFLTFGPDGKLIPSVNLDGRGEKYLPGACVACHGGSAINGRFPADGSASPYLGARFLPFDTGNYHFSNGNGLGEAAQGQALYDLNQLVKATERDWATSATAALVDGWYLGGGTVLNKAYVPPAWVTASASTPGADLLYREVVGASCRTCHAALGDAFNWDARPGRLLGGGAMSHLCGGSPELALNASMPNALISRDRVAERLRANPTLSQLVKQQFGCEAPLADPAYPRQ